ncbi:HNH endonuclease [Mucilaginibacter ginkgonis]|uniref:HNH endonuclease n=1 Tax=Mucilaginibacter ginkgonis TaxID=2682091 RepID=A0A6I4I7M3_9SPHI|nr:HNH endonuclease [Mucilaginibacter ginkgonis]QQL49129.1 HNH endonuclease [Mucilaginibacter ginkgonis]
MKDGQSLWTKEQSILAINLYCKIPFGQMHKGNKDVIELASLIDRSPSAVARKLGNFASFDVKLQQRGIKGLENVSKLDREVWQEYMHNWDEQFIESEKLLAAKKHTSVEKLNGIDLDNLKEVEGKERQRMVIVRVNQSLFRKIVLSNYDNRCCITGLNIPELVIASHIVPWSKHKTDRLNPNNGLALNALHDKAFDCGLLTVTEDLKVKVSTRLLKGKTLEAIKDNFLKYDGGSILEAKKFQPSPEFLKIHNDTFKS